MNQPSEPQVTILVRKNGPYLVTGRVILTNAKGEPLESKEVMSLCRCGESRRKPYCDGTHREVGFTDE